MATYVYTPYGSGATPSSEWYESCTYKSRYCGASCHGTNIGTRPLDIQGKRRRLDRLLVRSRDPVPEDRLKFRPRLRR